MNALDRAAALAMPLLVARHSGAIEPLVTGAKRMVCAADGLYAQASSGATEMCIRVADVETPYGPLEEAVVLRHGPIPLALLARFVEAAQATPDVEVAGVIEVDEGRYALRMIEPHSNGASHVTYTDALVDDETLVVDLHSHGRFQPVFSHTDDASDRSRRGPYIAIVVGCCHQENPRINCRHVLSPHLKKASLAHLVDTGVFA